MYFTKTCKFILAVSFVSIFGYFPFISGCGDDDGITPKGPGTDTNVAIYNNLVIHEFWNDSSWSSADLFLGQVVRDSSRLKDAHLADFNGDTTNFFLRSGDLSLDVPGYQTRFNRIYAHLEGFDTVSMINVGNRPIDPELDFTSDDTYGNGAWGYFTDTLSTKPVFSFYLKGKYSTVTSKRVYGVMHVKQVTRIPGDFLLTIDVKINKNEENKFVQ